MLERQQIQLIAAIQEMYSRMRNAFAWDGKPLDHHGAPPLTHDILAALDLLEPKNEGSGEMEPFEDLQNAPHSESAYDTSPQRKRQRSMSDLGQSRSISPVRKQQVSAAKPLLSSRPGDSPTSYATFSRPGLHHCQPYPTQRPPPPLAARKAREAPDQPSPPPTFEASPNSPPFQPFTSDSSSSILSSPTAIPTLFPDPQRCSPDWHQLLSDKSIGRSLELGICDPAPLFVQATAPTQQPQSTIENGPFVGREPRIWKRRLTSGIGFVNSDFMTDHPGLSGLNLTAVKSGKALGGGRDAVVPCEWGS